MGAAKSAKRKIRWAKGQAILTEKKAIQDQAYRDMAPTARAMKTHDTAALERLGWHRITPRELGYYRMPRLAKLRQRLRLLPVNAWIVAREARPLHRFWTWLKPEQVPHG